MRMPPDGFVTMRHYKDAVVMYRYGGAYIDQGLCRSTALYVTVYSKILVHTPLLLAAHADCC